MELSLMSLVCLVSATAGMPIDNQLLPVVETPYGKVVGSMINGTKSWLGIPFAAPPIGDLRFRPPQEPKSWTEPLEATKYAASCIQIGSPQMGRFAGPKNSAWNTLHVENSSEDCLFLNVYAPAVKKTEGLLPVMLYLHAGEFRFGGAYDDESDRLLGNDTVILVTANARLQYAGFAALDSLRKRDPTNSTGNYGIQDQRMVMQWVQKSIKAFGGDPTKVTIFGESSGGGSVSFHITSARSKGMFTRAIMESPGITQSKSWQHSMENTQYAAALLTAAGSPGCGFGNTARWLVLPGTSIRGRVLDYALSAPLARAKCVKMDNCVGVLIYDTGRAELIASGMLSNFSYTMPTVYNLTYHTGMPTDFHTEIRLADEDKEVDCLVNASALHLVMIATSIPHDDTFFTDAMAPTEDGVELDVPLGQRVRDTKI